MSFFDIARRGRDKQEKLKIYSSTKVQKYREYTPPRLRFEKQYCKIASVMAIELQSSFPTRVRPRLD